jgi:hypothetical protein
MPRQRCVTIVSVLAAAVLLAPAAAQEAAKPEAPKAQSAPIEVLRPSEPRRTVGPTLRVQVVVTRFQGERKVASLPYTFTATVDGRPVRMRMGVDTPVAVATTSGSEGSKPHTSFQYRNVGTNIDCAASDAGDGRYRLMLTVENSSALAPEKGPSSGASPSGPLVDANPTGAPLFRRFDTNIDPVLRDGQSVQTIASTDPVTGEVVKIDVTMNVVK